jgi:hypothetical protein
VEKIGKVYLVIHELFGMLFQDSHVELVTPNIPACKNDRHTMHHRHTYKFGRFKESLWRADAKMRRGEKYMLQGVKPGCSSLSQTSFCPKYNARPHRPLSPSKKPLPYCQLSVPIPKQIYQVRLLSISGPVFGSGGDGDPMNKEIEAISLVQVFEYDADNGKELKIVDKRGHKVDLDYRPDTVNDANNVNLHMWASIENESGMDDDMANEHAKCASDALFSLFDTLKLKGTGSLSVDACNKVQLAMPPNVHFTELMTLAERFDITSSHPNRKASGRSGRKLSLANKVHVMCSAKTCGEGGNLYVNGS